MFIPVYQALPSPQNKCANAFSFNSYSESQRNCCSGLVLPDDIQWIFGVYLEFFTKLQTIRRDMLVTDTEILIGCYRLESRC
ncbi:hypothetical protein EB796_003093 [Bugula neritina]|uniref:Uncharacterized protein n=1 Tax=Bugula neritina TaxID=10212 RepID=A0A7J7KK16_BUGNE|nr:hypothetical protein EB796_003093 [Bugula neritina]